MGAEPPRSRHSWVLTEALSWHRPSCPTNKPAPPPIAVSMCGRTELSQTQVHIRHSFHCRFRPDKVVLGILTWLNMGWHFDSVDSYFRAKVRVGGDLLAQKGGKSMGCSHSLDGKHGKWHVHWQVRIPFGVSLVSLHRPGHLLLCQASFVANSRRGQSVRSESFCWAGVLDKKWDNTKGKSTVALIVHGYRHAHISWYNPASDFLFLPIFFVLAKLKYRILSLEVGLHNFNSWTNFGQASVVKSTDFGTSRYWNFKNVHFPLVFECCWADF